MHLTAAGSWQTTSAALTWLQLSNAFITSNAVAKSKLVLVLVRPISTNWLPFAHWFSPPHPSTRHHEHTHRATANLHHQLLASLRPQPSRAR